MNVNHLKDDELRYELEVRGLTVSRSIRTSKRSLKVVLDDELAGKIALPTITVQDFETEFGICEAKYNELSLLEAHTRQGDYEVLISRAYHLVKRLERLERLDDRIINSELLMKIHTMIENALKWVNSNQGDYRLSSDSDSVNSRISLTQSTNIIRGSRERVAMPIMSIHPPQVSVTDNDDRNSRHRAQQGGSQRREWPLDQEEIIKRNRKPLSIYKWNIQFSGDGKGLKLNEFLSQVSLLADTEEVTEAELLRSAYHLVTGSAKVWYRAFYKNFRNWKEFVTALKREFLPEDNDYWVLKEIDKRLQKRGEPFGLYLAALELLFQDLSEQYSENQKLRIIRRNMLPIYSDKLSLFEITTIDTLKKYCRKIDNVQYEIEHRMNYSEKGHPQTRPNRESTFMINNQSSTDLATIKEEHINGNTVNQPKDKGDKTFHNSKSFNRLNCYNCGGLGHSFKVCRKPRNKVFCFKCGKDNVITSKCPKCSFKKSQAGNGH